MRDRATPNTFAGAYLDRRSDGRDAEDWLERALGAATTRIVVAQGTRQLVTCGRDTRIAFLAPDHPAVLQAPREHLLLLGDYEGAAVLLLEAAPHLPEDGFASAEFSELRPIVPALPEAEAALLAYARGLSIWRARGRFCGACGAPTTPRSAGHVLGCSNPACAQEFFPRIDPAIIVLISDGERALLGRQAEWPAGRYSTIAGFVEVGESLEDAVLREVMEETGVAVSNVRYQSSQPWPFPSSLMLGFRASAAEGSAVRITGELEDARWFTPQQIIEQRVMPISHSISYRLISEWLAERSAGPAL